MYCNNRNNFLSVGKLKRWGIYCCTTLFFTIASCTDKHPEPPVSLEKMTAITLDLHSAEYLSQYIKSSTGTHALDKNLDSLAVYYSGILKHYGMTLEAYQQAMHWYTNHPELLDSLYAHIIVAASELKVLHPEKTKGTPQESPQTEISDFDPGAEHGSNVENTAE